MILLLAGLGTACHTTPSAIKVLVTPIAATAALQGTAQFTATVSNATDTTVTWQVNGVTGGNATCGTITTNGLYTAPAALPAANGCNGTGGSGTTSTSNACSTSTGNTTNTAECVLITAVSNQSSSATGTAAVTLTSGVTISVFPIGAATVGTGETLTFTATVTGTANLKVNWFVNNTQGGSSTVGTITSTTTGDGTSPATYTAPATIPSPAAVTIEAQSAADTSQFQNVSVTIASAADPTLTAVSPPNVPAGAFLQDLYLTGTNFLSTSSVFFAGVNLSTVTGGNISAVSSTVLRARVPASLLGTPGPYTVLVRRQNGNTTPSLTVNVVPVRPSLLAATPVAVAQNSAATTIDLAGGYYTPSTLSEFNGHTVGTGPDVNFPHGLQAVLSASDLTSAGLFSIAVRTPAATPPRSAVNLSIRPSSTPAVTNKISGFSKNSGAGGGPVAVAVNVVTGVPVVVDQGNNALDLLDTAFTTITSSVPVGNTPTSVAVDSLRNFALVAVNGANPPAVSFVDLSVPAVALAFPVSPGGNAPYAVGVDEIHGRSIVVGQNAVAAVVLDTSAAPAGPPTVLGTVAITTGSKPQVAVLPQLGWAIVVPGGTGPLSVVDLTRLSVVFTSTINSTTRGVAVNTETKALLLADPASAFGSIFSLLNQSLTPVPLNVGNVAAAVNPFTNVGLLLNAALHQAVALDMSTPAVLGNVILGTDPTAVAIDAATDTALVADDVDGTVSVVDLGATRSRSGEPQILEVSPPLAFTSGTSVPLVITGAGFSAASAIRLNETPIPTTFVSSRELTASIPTNFLTGPLRIVVDVQNSATVFSNVFNLLVVQAVPVGNSPLGVAIDPSRDLALAVNTADNTVSVIDLSPTSATFGTVTSTITVGKSPVSVAVVSHNGLGAVSNSADSTTSILNLASNPISVPSTVAVGGNPTGVAVSESLGSAIVTNTASNSVALIPLSASGTPSPSGLAVDSQPVAAATAPDLNLAAVVNSAGNTGILLSISTGVPVFVSRISGIRAPTGVDYDPANQLFLIESSASNTIVAVSPITLLQLSIRTGVNPTSLSYNVQSGTVLTLNSSSNTLSVLDFPNTQVRDVLPISGSIQYAVAIHPRLNLAVISDSANNRVLLLPAPR